MTNQISEEFRPIDARPDYAQPGENRTGTARLNRLDPAGFEFRHTDQEIVRQRLAGFIPPDVVDVHAHLYDLRMLEPPNPTTSVAAAPAVGLRVYDESLGRWLNGCAPRQGLFFAFPSKKLDTRAANEFVAYELRNRPGSLGLLMIRPDDDPDSVATEVTAGGWAGFKVYHLFGNRPDTQDCLIGEFLPDWAWEIADRCGLVIMLHLVRQRSLADPQNQAYIREHCRRYPDARLVLAHAARGFCGPHTAEGIDAIRDLDNVFFDTSAICESLPLEAILRTYGPSRLLFGTDFPVSEFRGKPFTIGNGFCWIYDDSIDWNVWRMGQPTLVGIESVLAVQQACRTLCLTDGDVERIFAGNARQLLARGLPLR